MHYLTIGVFGMAKIPMMKSFGLVLNNENPSYIYTNTIGMSYLSWRGIMKINETKQIIGSATILLNRQDVERFLRIMMVHNVPVWKVIQLKNGKCQADVSVLHLKSIQSIMDEQNFEIEILHKRGPGIIFGRLMKRRALLVSILLSMTLLFVLANLIWSVKITGVSTQMEVKLSEALHKKGLVSGNFSFKLDSLNIIQDEILNEIPELLYIGIEKSGTRYEISAVEKLIKQPAIEKEPQDLIATKSGIVEKMYIRKGIPTVEVNDFVKVGDLLASGTYESLVEEEEPIRIAAEGEVYANVWYEVIASTSLLNYNERLTGEKISRRKIGFGDLVIPFWGFKKSTFKDEFEETKKNDLYLFKWKLPFQMYETTIFEKEINEEVKTMEVVEKEMELFILDQFQSKIGQDVSINKYYILHDSTVNGKVKFRLYISVLENVAKAVPIESNTFKGAK